ncbi:PREDICTED: hydroxyacylglutathione hydrolase cytoplasmic-like [Ipomoea nil]|uniref:hydroxyacylglutathione hydrolase cytoplasmic-like n=1 Tax=Ipomoea nil TaxID=35883 RepID=UPI0009016688|nr:PREDICTED: hydroxyacylglutathione hydrolase cytoplasmic-like [Ipomoea nil]
MKIVPVQCFEDDRYSYLIIDESTREAAAVDPADTEKVLQAADANAAEIKIVLTTHHHHYHAGGNEKMKEMVPGVRVYGGALDDVEGCTHGVQDGDTIALGAYTTITCLLTPCHTNGHISYFVSSKEGGQPAVFTGDTLFAGGCGKFFEGTAEQMYESLCKTLAALPKLTLVYCAHEYTVKNLEFGSTIEPDNVRVKEKLEWARQQRKFNLPTIPSTIEDELETNPFLRVDLPKIQDKLESKSPVEALKKLRQLKDKNLS